MRAEPSGVIYSVIPLKPGKGVFMENNSAIIEKHYSIPYELFGDAFKTFQKRYVMPRNYVVIGVLLAAAIVNVFYIAFDYGSTVNYVAMMFCLAFACVVWYNPKKLRRNLMEAIKGIENDEYVMKLYPEKIVIGTVIPNEEKSEQQNEDEYDGVFDNGEPEEEISDTEIFLNSSVKVYEKLDFFIVYIQKAMFYVIPKSALSDEENMMLRVHFEKQLGKNFKKDKQIA